MKQLRHSILHPENRVHLGSRWKKLYEAVDLEFSGDNLRMAITAQSTIDEYLTWLRGSLQEQVGAEIHELRRVSHLVVREDESRLTGLQMAVDVLSRPLPAMDNLPDSQEIQTPPSIIVWKPLLDASNIPRQSPPNLYPEHLRKVRAHCWQMLLRAIVCLSECFALIDIEKMLEYQRSGMTQDEALSNPLALLLPDKVPTNEQQMYDQVSLLRVGGALLSMPLRIYKEATERRPELRHDGIEELMGGGFDQSALDSFRNIVFHVADVTVDPGRVESTQTRQAEQMPVLLEHLIEFYSSIGR